MQSPKLTHWEQPKERYLTFTILFRSTGGSVIQSLHVKSSGATLREILLKVHQTHQQEENWPSNGRGSQLGPKRINLWKYSNENPRRSCSSESQNHRNNLVNLPNVGVPTETDRGDEEEDGETTGDLIKILLAKSIIISSRRSLCLPVIVPEFVWPSTGGSWGQVGIQSN